MLNNHTPRKRYGQNFLHDKTVIDRIVDALQLQQQDQVVEIGPGLGALTKRILPLLKELHVVELDRSLIPKLQKNCEGLGRLIIHPQDALKFDFNLLTQHQQSLKIIGNLPYNISTPLIFHLLDQTKIINAMYFMLQKEVVDRMAAVPNTKIYGRLSVMVQYYCQVQTLFNVKPGAFNPAPKVDSAFVQLIPYVKPPYIAHDPKILTDVVRLAFNQRRKTLRNSLSDVISSEQLISMGIDPTLRAERLGIKEFVQIANSI